MSRHVMHSSGPGGHGVTVNVHSSFHVLNIVEISMIEETETVHADDDASGPGVRNEHPDTLSK